MIFAVAAVVLVPYLLCCILAAYGPIVTTGVIVIPLIIKGWLDRNGD